MRSVEFLHSVRRHLERVARLGPLLAAELAAHRRHLLDVLDDLAKHTGDRKLAELHQDWSSRLDAFVSELEPLLVGGFAAGAPRDEVTRLIDIVLSRELGLDATAESKGKNFELDRLSRRAFQLSETARKTSQTAAEYTSEIRATKRSGDRWIITPIGKLIVELPDLDARRWLLTVEAVQSTGESDKWRLSRTGAARLVRSPQRVALNVDGPPWPATWETLIRLHNLGVAETIDDDECWTTVEILPEGRRVLEEIAGGQSTPFAMLAEALLQDETATALNQIRAAATLVQTEGIAAGTVRHSRMVAHEIRNALVPVRESLDDLYENALRANGGPLIEKYRAPIDTGIDRIFRFVKELVDVAALANRPAEPFEVLAAIDDAVAAARRDLGVTVTLSFPPCLPSMSGHRGRFTLALVNIFRNATQARADVEIRVDIALHQMPEEVVVTVDDNGPGVPDEHRTAIFDPGFSLRLGGSGQGLALVREVVEVEMLGSVVCERSPLGGARFVLSLPVRGGVGG